MTQKSEPRSVDLGRFGFAGQRHAVGRASANSQPRLGATSKTRSLAPAPPWPTSSMCGNGSLMQPTFCLQRGPIRGHHPRTGVHDSCGPSAGLANMRTDIEVTAIGPAATSPARPVWGDTFTLTPRGPSVG